MRMHLVVLLLAAACTNDGGEGEGETVVGEGEGEIVGEGEGEGEIVGEGEDEGEIVGEGEGDIGEGEGEIAIGEGEQELGEGEGEGGIVGEGEGGDEREGEGEGEGETDTRIIIAAPGCLAGADGHILPQFVGVADQTWRMNVRHMGNPGTAELDQQVANPVTWDVGFYTGLHVDDPRVQWQRGFLDLGPPDGTNAFQVQCTAAGSMINTYSFDRSEPVVGGGPNVTYGYDLATIDIRPWGEQRQQLVLRLDAEIPWLSVVADAVGQFSMYGYFVDVSTGIVVAQLYGIFDSRADGVGSGFEFVGNDTFVNFASGPIDTGLRYSQPGPGSDVMHHVNGFAGLRTFEAVVTTAQWQNVIADINVRRQQAGQMLMSTLVSDYRVTGVGWLQEVFVEGREGAEISMGIHTDNFSVFAE
jgi:hypothetical protein